MVCRVGEKGDLGRAQIAIRNRDSVAPVYVDAETHHVGVVLLAPLDIQAGYQNIAGKVDLERGERFGSVIGLHVGQVADGRLAADLHADMAVEDLHVEDIKRLRGPDRGAPVHAAPFDMVMSSKVQIVLVVWNRSPFG